MFLHLLTLSALAADPFAGCFTSTGLVTKVMCDAGILSIDPFTIPPATFRAQFLGAWGMIYPTGKLSVETHKLAGQDAQIEVMQIYNPDGSLKQAHYAWIRTNDVVQCQFMFPDRKPTCLEMIAAVADGTLGQPPK